MFIQICAIHTFILLFMMYLKKGNYSLVFIFLIKNGYLVVVCYWLPSGSFSQRGFPSIMQMTGIRQKDLETHTMIIGVIIIISSRSSPVSIDFEHSLWISSSSSMKYFKMFQNLLIWQETINKKTAWGFLSYQLNWTFRWAHTSYFWRVWVWSLPWVWIHKH